jgi:hypothetical protein
MEICTEATSEATREALRKLGDSLGLDESNGGCHATHDSRTRRRVGRREGSRRGQQRDAKRRHQDRTQALRRPERQGRRTGWLIAATAQKPANKVSNPTGLETYCCTVLLEPSTTWCFARWAMLGSNQRPLRCERSALPLSQSPRDCVPSPASQATQTSASAGPDVTGQAGSPPSRLVPRAGRLARTGWRCGVLPGPRGWRRMSAEMRYSAPGPRAPE